MILDGKKLANDIKNECIAKTKKLLSQKIVPGLAVVLVGDNPASQVYVSNKEKTAKEIGFFFHKETFPNDAQPEEIKKSIMNLNKNPDIHGIIVQLPLPSHLNENEIINTIDPSKDVDGLHPVNLGKLILEEESFIPCTPLGIMTILEKNNISTKGKNTVVVGRSNIVGKPMAIILLSKHKGDATVTVCHSRTYNLPQICKTADILIVAIGKPKVINRNFVKEGAVIIDVGINRILDPSKPSGTKLTGDVDFDDVKDICSAITPVPGGVGPMTVAMLMANTLKACERQFNIKYE